MTDFLETLRTPREQAEFNLRMVGAQMSAVLSAISCGTDPVRGVSLPPSIVDQARDLSAEWSVAQTRAHDARLAEILGRPTANQSHTEKA